MCACVGACVSVCRVRACVRVCAYVRVCILVCFCVQACASFFISECGRVLVIIRFLNSFTFASARGHVCVCL